MFQLLGQPVLQQTLLLQKGSLQPVSLKYIYFIYDIFRIYDAMHNTQVELPGY